MPKLDTRWPFTRRQALSAGISAGALRGPRYTQLFRGIYIESRVPFHPEIRTRAALLAHPPRAFASYHSAAKQYHLPVPHTPVEHVSVFDQADRRRRDGIVSHVAPAQPLVWVRGVPVPTPVQLFIDLAAMLDLVDLVVLGDAMVRSKRCTVQELVDACNAWCGPRAREARLAAGYVRAKVDSVMESRLRMLIVLAGLPEPQVNYEILDEIGQTLFALDLSYPELKLAVEYDGQQHREDLEQWNSDISRGDWLERRGWRRLPVVSKGIFRRPDETVERVHAALLDRGYKGLPHAPSDTWRTHFPVIR